GRWLARSWLRVPKTLLRGACFGHVPGTPWLFAFVRDRCNSVHILRTPSQDHSVLAYCSLLGQMCRPVLPLLPWHVHSPSSVRHLLRGRHAGTHVLRAACRSLSQRYRLVVSYRVQPQGR